jgi:hypothetical protein
MHAIAPEECLLFASWATKAQADPQSANHTEQLFAEPELAEFAQYLEQAVIGNAINQMPDMTPEEKQALRKSAAQIVRTLLTRSTSLFVSKLEFQDPAPVIEAAIMVDAAEQAAGLRTTIGALLAKAGAEPTEATIGTFKFTRLVPPGGGPTIHVGAMGPYLLVTLGDGVAEKVIERARAKKIPAWLTKISQELPIERRASISYINTPAWMDKIAALGGPSAGQTIATLGLRGLGPIASATGLEGTGMVTRTQIAIDGPPQGILQLLNGNGLKPEQLQHVPADSAVAAAYSLNAGRAYDVLFDMVRASSPGEEQALTDFAEQFRETTGVAFREELLLAIGDTWTGHMSPADGWYAGLTLSVAINDRGKLDRLNEHLIALVNRRNDGPAPGPVSGISITKSGPLAIHALQFFGPVPFAPAWCIADDRLYVTPFPSALKSLGAEQRPKPLLTNGAWSKLLQTSSDPILSLGYQDSAKTFELTYPYVAMLVPMLINTMNEQADESGIAPLVFDSARLPAARTIHRHLEPMMSVVRRTKAGVLMETRQTIPTPDMSTMGPVAVAAALPAMQAGRQAARRIQGSNNLKQIGLGFHNFHDTYNGMPPAYLPDAMGKPGLSWRVAILPFVEQQGLYNQFKLDEPWDSEHNKKLIPLMPQVYRDPQSKAENGKTVYLGIAGKTGIFQPPVIDRRAWKPRDTFAAVTDGTSNTALAITVDDAAAVIWTKPDDYVFDVDDPFRGVPKTDFNVLRCDGSVTRISQKIGAEMWRRLLDKSDGQVVEIP